MVKRKARFVTALLALLLLFSTTVAGVRAAEPDPSQTPVAGVPEEYIRERLSDPETTYVRVKILDPAGTVSKELLNTLRAEEKSLTVSVYGAAEDPYPEYEWYIHGSNIYYEVEEDFDLGVSIDLPEVRQNVAEEIADDSVWFTAFTLDHKGDVPDGVSLCLPTENAMYESQQVYFYDREQGKITHSSGYAGYADAYPNGWWMSVHTFNPGFSRGGGDYIITSSNLDYETKGGYYSDIAEAEAEIARRLASDDREITIYMGYYYGREYQLSVETLNAVKASGKTLHILFPGVEASATYMWTFRGSEMGEVTAPVDLIVTFPMAEGDETAATIRDAVMNETQNFVLDFWHSGSLPAGTDFSTLMFGDVDASQGGYYYYYDEEAGKLRCSGRTSYETWMNYGRECLFVRLEDMTHCSYYLVTDIMAEGPDVDNTMPQEPDPGTGTTDPTTPGTGTTGPTDPGTAGPTEPGAAGQENPGTGTADPAGQQAAETQAPKTGDGYEREWFALFALLWVIAAVVCAVRFRWTN